MYIQRTSQAPRWVGRSGFSTHAFSAALCGAGRSVGTARVGRSSAERRKWVGRSGRPESVRSRPLGESVGRDRYVCVVYKDLLQYTHTTTTHLHSSTRADISAPTFGPHPGPRPGHAGLATCWAAPDSATLPAPCPGRVGRSGRPDSGLAAKPAGEGRSVGSFRPKIFFAALRAAVGRSGETESETQKILKESRSARTLNVLSTSHRPVASVFQLITTQTHKDQSRGPLVPEGPGRGLTGGSPRKREPVD